MSFIVGAIAGVVGAVGGAIISSKGAKRSSEIAAAGSDREIEYLRESRDLARGDQAPYREAGYTALDALMSMTGLGGGAKPATPRGPRGPGGQGGGVATRRLNAARGGRDGGGRRSAYGRAYGGHLYGRNEGGDLYNINELGPESVYENGSYTRSGMPMTVPPSNGYVAPNIQGRQRGGFLPRRVGVSDPNPTLLQAGSGAQSGADIPQMHIQPDGTVRPGADIPQLQAGPTYGAQGDYINSSLPDKNDIKYGDSQLPVGTGGFANTALGGETGVVPFGNQGGATIDNATGAPLENPGGVEGGYNFMTDPGYGFRIGEGERALERSAAARGGLLSGGYGRKLTRYAQDYASNEYTNVYNRISNIARLGQVSAGQSGNAAL
ncbi:hypothetical protein LCGC14_1831460, partial [marine sediment metagenome]